jgi:hypothetical protein
MKRVFLAMAAILLFSITSFAQSEMLTLDSAPLGMSAGASQPSDAGIAPEAGRRHHRHHHHKHPRG